jgi:uncharacterized protein YcaQ
MPVLLGEKFIGRFDAKADRKNRVFEVINFFVEDGVTVQASEIEMIRTKITELGLFTGCTTVSWDGTLK